MWLGEFAPLFLEAYTPLEFCVQDELDTDATNHNTDPRVCELPVYLAPAG